MNIKDVLLKSGLVAGGIILGSIIAGSIVYKKQQEKMHKGINVLGDILVDTELCDITFHGNALTVKDFINDVSKSQYAVFKVKLLTSKGKKTRRINYMFL